MISWLIIIFLFVMGSAVGSFLNVVISRTIKEESWIKGRSKCDHCRQQITWFDNIPLLSFLFLKGKARCCGKPIPISYPILELMTGLLFVWWYLVGSLFFRLTTAPLQVIQPLFWLVVGILLLVILMADLLYLIIPNLAVYPLFALTLIYRLYLTFSGVMQQPDLMNAFLGMGLAVGLILSLWGLTKGKGMGLGDAKLAAPMALLLGWPQILVGLFLAFFCGGLVAIGLLLAGKKKFGQVIPFGPFMVLGTVLSLLWGDQLLAWYLGWL